MPILLLPYSSGGVAPPTPATGGTWAERPGGYYPAYPRTKPDKRPVADKQYVVAIGELVFVGTATSSLIQPYGGAVEGSIAFAASSKSLLYRNYYPHCEAVQFGLSASAETEFYDGSQDEAFLLLMG